MSMTPSEDEQIVRTILAAPERWRSQPEARQAAEVRVGLAQARATRAQSIITYLTADRSGWPVGVDQMLRSELGIDDLPALPDESQMAVPPTAPDHDPVPFEPATTDGWVGARHHPSDSALFLQYEDEQFGS